MPGLSQQQIARNVKRKQKLLEYLEQTGRVDLACKLAKVPRRTAYAWRMDDSEFSKDWEIAIDRAVGLLEDEAHRRAHEGTDEPQFYQGVVCGHVRKYSDTLLIFLLKAHRPERYRDRASIEHTGANGAPLQAGPTNVQIVLVPAANVPASRALVTSGN